MSAATPARKSPKKVVKKAAPSHPTYSDMVKRAVVALKDRSGSSREAILKYILANFKLSQDPKMINNHLKVALRNGVTKGTLKHAKASSVGASGRFRIGDKAEKKTKVPKAKKPSAKKPRSPSKAKKSPKKKVAAKKPAASKPKQAKKPATKKPKAAKKSPTKKVVKKTKKATPKKARKA